MAVPPVFSFMRGETIALALRLKSGDVAAVQTVTGRLRRLTAGQTTPVDGEPVAADLDVAFTAAAGDVPAFWTLSKASGPLVGNRFAANAWVTFTTGQVEPMDPVIIVLDPAV